MSRVMKVSAALLFVFAGCNLSFRSCAQSETMQFYTTLSKNGAIPDLCVAEQMVLGPILYRYERPAAWRWIIVCDEMAWRQVERHEGRESNSSGVYLAFTEPDNRLTYVRGWTLLHPVNDTPQMQPDHTIRHELGHILKNTGDEAAAEECADVLLARWRSEQAALASALAKSKQTQPVRSVAATSNLP